MPGISQQLVGWALLHDSTQIHDGNPVSDLSYNRQVVRDEQIREAALPLQIREQIEHLSLDRNVES
jgi:hypothetical protein